MQIAGGRTWIRTRDLFLIRQARLPVQMDPGKPSESQAVTRTVAICSEIWGRFPNASQRNPSQTRHLGCRMIAPADEPTRPAG